MRKRHIHPIHVHGLSKSGNLRCFLPHYNSHPPNRNLAFFYMHLSQKSIFIVVLQELRRFAIIRELPSPLMFAFIRDLVGLGRFYIK